MWYLSVIFSALYNANTKNRMNLITKLGYKIILFMLKQKVIEKNLSLIKILGWSIYNRKINNKYFVRYYIFYIIKLLYYIKYNRYNR